MTDIQENPVESQKDDELTAALEALLFVASGPVSPSQLAEVLGKNSTEVNNGLKRLEAILANYGGLALQWHKSKVQLTSSPQHGNLIEEFLGLEASSQVKPGSTGNTIDHCLQTTCHPASTGFDPGREQ